jgi:hypothetical protein
MNHFSLQFTRNFITSSIAAVALAVSAAAMAQAPAAPTRLRGTVEKISGDSIDIKAKGKTATYKIAPDASFMAVGHTDISAIKSDSFIGTTAIPQADGTLKALEVHVFPAGMKSGEGHYAWDIGGSKSTMTNGTVGSVVVSNGRTITVKYPNGEKQVVVPADVPIVSLEKGDRSLLVPGAHGVFFMTKGADGAEVVGRGAVGKGDVVPPM